MLKVDAQTYQEILEAVLKCATRCFFRGNEEDATKAIGEEYKECTDEIFKILGGKIEQ
jgi:hypothetical protein